MSSQIGKTSRVSSVLKLPRHWRPTTRAKTRNVCFVLLGVAALVLKGDYSGPFQQAVHSYGGNIAASFAVYYVIALLPLPPRFGKLLTAGLALVVVELFEASNGFGVMTNVYDPVDFEANAVGIALALAVDVMTSGISRRRSHHGDQAAEGTEGRPVA